MVSSIIGVSVCVVEHLPSLLGRVRIFYLPKVHEESCVRANEVNAVTDCLDHRVKALDVEAEFQGMLEVLLDGQLAGRVE